jgi:hypothetical protein
MSKEVKVALIGAAATIIAALIGGIFLYLQSRPSVSSLVVPTATTSALASTTITTQTTLPPSSLSERTKQRSGQPLRQRVRPSRHGLKRLNGARSPTENGR